MVVFVFVVAIIGIISILLSIENDKLKKASHTTKKSEEDRLYKVSVMKAISEKIAYETDPEKIIDEIMISLRNFYNFAAASSMVIKDAHIVFKTYLEEKIGPAYYEKIETSMISSFERLIGKIPLTIEKKTYGFPIDEAITSIYASSFHLPLIANNKVIALIHLSSMEEDAFKDTTDLHELIESASSALTHFNQSIASEIEKYSSLIGSLKDGILLVDNRGNLLIINNTAKNILELPENVLLTEVTAIFGDTYNLENKIRDSIMNKSSIIDKEIKIKDKVLNIFVTPVGKHQASITLRDMTDYKKKEMLKEDLIHIMVHELRAPTTTIKDSSELIITSEDTLEKEKKAKFMEIIHTQAKKVLGQIGSILDTAKLDAGKLVLQKTQGDIAKLIQEEVKTFMPQAERKNINLGFNLASSSIPQFSFDEIRISQVIDNLLSNALKFTPEGGKITVSLDYKRIPPVLDGTSPMGEFLSLSKYILVSVSDSGIGISPEQQKLLFTKYTQAQNSSEKIATMGTGLGLYLIKGIVEAHEGRIWVKSAQGSGTTFSFTLPATDVAKEATNIPRPPTTPQAQLVKTVN